MLEGQVRWFNQDKGFGFIRPFDKSKEDVFLHITDVKRSGYKDIAENDYVEFEVEVGNDGKERAVKIVKFEYVYE